MSQSDDSLTFSIHACYLSTKLSGANDLCVYTSIFFCIYRCKFRWLTSFIPARSYELFL